MKKIENIVLEKLITGNNIDLIELCDELGYLPQKHGFMKVSEGNEKLHLVVGWRGKKEVQLSDLYKCDIFIEHINLYISNLNKDD